MHRAYEAVDNHVGPSITTGLKETISKLHEKYKEIKITKSTKQLDVEKWSDNHTLGILFILNSDKNRFGQLLTDSHNDYLKRTYSYP